MITLTPEPAAYPTAQTISLTLSPEFSSVIFTQNGTSPTLAKYIAYDTLSPPNPFIAVVQDGKGNALFDGGFPKWYNGHVNTAWTTFAEMTGAFKYLVNALNFIANPAKVAAGNRKVLFLGDANSGEHYNVKDTASSSFKTSFDKACQIAGYTPTYRTRSDWGGMIDITYADLDQYCAVVLMSSVYATTQLITNVAVSNITAFREAGNGIFLITDHGVGGDGFYKTANYVAANLGAYFEGNYNRTPVNVGFLRTTYGDHPLYNNLTNAESIHAGESESRVVVTQSPIYTSANLPTITTPSTGIFTVRFLLQRPDGTIETTSATYAINIVEPVRFVASPGGATLTAASPRYNPAFNLHIALDNVSFGAGTRLSGLMKVNSNVIGTFSGTVGTPVYAFSSGGNALTLQEGTNQLEIELQLPVKFFKTLSANVVREPSLPLSVSRLAQRLNRHDLATSNPHRVLKNASSVLGLPRRISFTRYLNSIRNYVT